MSKQPNKVSAITKDEILHSMSDKTGFTLGNCRKAYDALVEVFRETMLDGRAIVFKKFGRLEPYTKKPRLFYRINREEGLMRDAAGRPETFVFPECKNVKFMITTGFKHKMNPEIYMSDDLDVEDFE